jgi:hypothetical protein
MLTTKDHGGHETKTGARRQEQSMHPMICYINQGEGGSIGEETSDPDPPTKMHRGVEETFQSKQKRCKINERLKSQEQGLTFRILCCKRYLLRCHPGAVEQSTRIPTNFENKG